MGGVGCPFLYGGMRSRLSGNAVRGREDGGVRTKAALGRSTAADHARRRVGAATSRRSRWHTDTDSCFWVARLANLLGAARNRQDHRCPFARQRNRSSLEQLSAVFSGVADLKRVFAAAKARREHGQGSLLFVDEIHRFNRAQQDSFLPVMEDGTVCLVGATTEIRHSNSTQRCCPELAYRCSSR